MTHKRTGFCLACVAAAFTIFTPLNAQSTQVVLADFPSLSPNGATPYAGVTPDAAGNLYGTSYAGGAANQGVVYKVDASGKQTVRYSFTGGLDGAKPQGGVILDTAGNLYGTTSAGGAANRGVVFKVDPAGNETVLYSFAGKLDGGQPLAGLINDSTGNLYGTAYSGGVYGVGVLFMLDPAGHETVLYNFMGGANGSYPSGPVIRDSAGNFYGTTPGGGTSLQQCAHPPAGCGIVYKVNPAGQLTVLHTFVDGPDGADPFGGLVRDQAGNLYGTASLGGANGFGVVFKISPQHQETVLHTFTGGGDGGNPQAGVVRDAAGNLYGTTYHGGSGSGGVVYKLDSSGEETVIHSFKSYSQGPDGYFPYAGVTLDGSGNLYGTTQNGGPALFGALYKLNSAGEETILACFNGAAEGSSPQGGVIGDSAGNLYGTTYYGGPENAGVVYKINPAGVEQVLYSFTGGADGGNPYGQLLRDPAGNLYGVTVYGGKGEIGFESGGVVFKIDPSGHETVLYTFPAGVYPQSTLARDASGNLYGATFEGGKGGCYGYPSCGAIYRLDGSGHYQTLYSFTGVDGGNPNGGLILDSQHNLYGATQRGGSAGWGVIYQLDQSGNETVLYTFTGGGGEGVPTPGGGIPETGLVRDSTGNLYGTTISGGAAGYGVVFRIDLTGSETVLYSFTGSNTNNYNSPPYSTLTLDTAGNLYGTSAGGGVPGCSSSFNSCGVVFQVTPSGQYNTLYNFTGADGGNPQAPVTFDPSGNLYGTASTGGARGGGVVYKLEGPFPGPH